ncbi:MAG TPA: MarR family winged helix-turn-helix transcriptional regulator [Acidimicrobiales bacterium]|nr:MarR family winged helix-turn-helix transcriptional regulator [Acidimicrobiales bacterium]
MHGAELSDTVAQLRRATRQAVRRRAGPSPFRNAEIELILALMNEPGQTVANAAARLGLAPNTVSTLVSKAVADGWVLRQVDPDDRRAARLFASDAAARRVRTWRAHRAAVIDESVLALSQRDQRALAAALPALRRLTEHIDRDSSRADSDAEARGA